MKAVRTRMLQKDKAFSEKRSEVLLDRLKKIEEETNLLNESAKIKPIEFKSKNDLRKKEREKNIQTLSRSFLNEAVDFFADISVKAVPFSKDTSEKEIESVKNFNRNFIVTNISNESLRLEEFIESKEPNKAEIVDLLLEMANLKLVTKDNGFSDEDVEASKVKINEVAQKIEEKKKHIAKRIKVKAIADITDDTSKLKDAKVLNENEDISLDRKRKNILENRTLFSSITTYFTKQNSERLLNESNERILNKEKSYILQEAVSTYILLESMTNLELLNLTSTEKKELCSTLVS